MKYTFFIVVVLCVLTPLVYAQGVEATISNPSPFQGDTALVTFTDVSLTIDSATLNGKDIGFFRYKNHATVIFGIAGNAVPGIYELRVRFTNGVTYTHSFTVRKKSFPVVNLGIPEKLGLTPSGLVKTLQTEKVNLDKTLTVLTPKIYFNAPFGLPLSNNRKIGSVFGETRQTGNQQIRHWGVDLGASRGAAVAAINAGVVSKAYYDTVYGNTVIVDHGEGIYSMYLHLDSMKVKEGDAVRLGTLLGRAGETGYSEGPHLHLSIKVNGVSVDPLVFVRQFK